ncbi:MAG: hypothetical protein JXR37_33005 [Kiritimatiellae bacterium]|nr:hypothetical protein [Kiritimatiellia bacterium]
MTAREKLQAAYELAFYPPRFHEVWREVKRHAVQDREQLLELVRMALLLHAALPSSRYSSERALRRLALYQADARAFRTPTCLRNLYRVLGGDEPLPTGEMPGWMVRDIGLPPFCHDSVKRAG